MSIASEINRINQQKNIIRDKMRDMGLVGQTESPNIDGLASKLKNGVRVDTGFTAREVLEGESITIEAGYYKSNVTVSGITNEAADKQKIKSFDDKITPAKSEQNFDVPEGYYGFGSFSVKAIGDEYQDTSDATVEAKHVLVNKTFYNSQQGRQVGEMPNYGILDRLEIDALSNTPYYERVFDGYVDTISIGISSSLINALREI